MKRVLGLFILFSFLLCSIGQSKLFASPVDSVTARVVAQHFLASHGVESCMVEGKTAPLSLATLPYSDMYLFVGDSCFVIVAGNDAAVPILAYSCDSEFDVDQLSLCNSVAGYLASFESQLRMIDKDDVQPTESVSRQWAELIAGVSRRAKGGVAPLLTTRWGQGDPYSRMCPYDSTSMSRCVVGCLATAMAQVMRYWNYPSQGIGSYCYNSRYGQICADFENTAYDWNNMPDILTSGSSARQINAVSQLMYHCGVALEMSYSPNGSSAFLWGGNRPAVDVLVDNFGFLYGCYVLGKHQTSPVSWVRMLKDELDARRPLLYMGTGENSGGHGFVCDGYDDESRFHFNWGWNGMYDGYFAMDALNPGPGGIGSGGQSTFNDDNYAIFSLSPPDRLRVTPYEVALSPNADTTTVTVISSMASSGWSASTDASWLSFSPETGVGSSIWTDMKIMAEPNETGHARSAVILIKQGIRDVYVKVNQFSCDLLEDFPFEEGFEGVSTQCWTKLSTKPIDDSLWGVRLSAAEYVYGGGNSFWFTGNNASAGSYQYLISMPLQLPSGVSFEFNYRRLMSYDERFDILYSTTDNNPESFIYLVSTNLVTTAGWHQFKGYVPQNAHYVAIRYHNKGSNSKNLIVDHIVITPSDDIVECSDIVVLPYVESFEDTLACWTIARATNSNDIGVEQKSKSYDGKNVFIFNSLNKSKDYNQYLISPAFYLTDSVKVSFWYRKEGMRSEYAVLRTSSRGNTIEEFDNIVDTVVATSNKWTYYETLLPPETRYVMLNYFTNNQVALWIDDFRVESLNHKESIYNVKTINPVLSVSGLQVKIAGLQGERVRVYDIMGREVFSCRGEDHVSFRLPAAGIYVMYAQSYRSFVAF